mgnify:CR=1 FL=1
MASSVLILFLFFCCGTVYVVTEYWVVVVMDDGVRLRKLSSSEYGADASVCTFCLGMCSVPTPYV